MEERRPEEREKEKEGENGFLLGKTSGYAIPSPCGDFLGCYVQLKAVLRVVC
jgi:hypothetical protein